MLDWLRNLLGPPAPLAVDILVEEVDRLHALLEVGRAEKMKLLEEAREAADRTDRLHRRTIEDMTQRLHSLMDDFVAIASEQSRAAIERSRWSSAHLAAASGPSVPDPRQQGLEGAGEEAVERLAGLRGEPGGADPPWSHSLVAEGHALPPEGDAEAEEAAMVRERIRAEGSARG